MKNASNPLLTLLVTLSALLVFGTALAQGGSGLVGEGNAGTNPACIASGGSATEGLPHECQPTEVTEDPDPCVDCASETATLEQDIEIEVPTVVRLVLDDNYSDAQDQYLDAWTLDFTSDTADNANCFVIPNWVGLDTTFGEFLYDVGGAENLVSWSAEYGYPAIINDGDVVLNWGDVADVHSAYKRDGGNLPAKGNVVCYNEFMVEKYTNCPGVAFYVELENNSDTRFGDLNVQDWMRYSGSPDDTEFQGSAYFDHETTGMKKLANVPMHHFYDDYVSQWLDLTRSEPGSHDLTLTYTLGSAVAVGY